MNKIIAVIAIVFAFTLGTIFSADIATAVKPVTEVFVTNTEPIEVTGSLTSNPVCPAENVQHWNTFSWDTVQIIRHPTLPSIGGGYLEIQVPTDKNYSDKGFVVARLTELGYLDSQNNPLTTSNIDTATAGSSSMICAEN